MAKGGPDLKRYMDKNLALKLNGNRVVKVSSHFMICGTDLLLCRSRKIIPTRGREIQCRTVALVERPVFCARDEAVAYTA